MTAAFTVRDLTVTYAGTTTPALQDVSVEIPRGSLFAFIGPNGSGKSTLIRSMLGAIEPDRGVVCFEDRPVLEWSRRDLARRIGAVTQVEEMPFPITVRDLVAMGRYPYLGGLRPEGEEDRNAVEHAMQRCDVAHLANRSIATLSGGERQRARIARALAQTVDTLVLDEPTVALDIGHEMQIFELLRALTRDGWTVVVATHHLNLAARYAHALLLLDSGRAAMIGDADAVIKKSIIESAYEWPVTIYQHGGPGFDSGAPQLAPLSQLQTEEP